LKSLITAGLLSGAVISTTMQSPGQNAQPLTKQHAATVGQNGSPGRKNAPLSTPALPGWQ